MNLKKIMRARIINNNITKEKIEKDEYQNFMKKFPDIKIDDNNLKILIKNFISVIDNKIASLENNIQEINEQIKKINKNNIYYFKSINDSIDIINKKYFKKKENNKEKSKEYNIHNFNHKSLLYRNDTDLNIFEKEKIKKNMKIFINPIIYLQFLIQI